MKNAYLDGELCALRPDGVPAFSRLQAAMDEGRTHELVGQTTFEELVPSEPSAAALHRHPDQRPTELYIDELGVVTRLLEPAFALGRELDCIEAWLGAEPDNLPPWMLYQGRSLPGEPFTMYVIKLGAMSPARRTAAGCRRDRAR